MQHEIILTFEEICLESHKAFAPLFSQVHHSMFFHSQFEFELPVGSNLEQVRGVCQYVRNLYFGFVSSLDYSHKDGLKPRP